MITLLKSDFRKITSANSFFHASANCENSSNTIRKVGELFTQQAAQTELLPDSYLLIPTAGTARCASLIIEPNSLAFVQGGFLEANELFHCFYFQLARSKGSINLRIDWEINNLVPVVRDNDIQVYVGQFQGREKGVFEIQPHRNACVLVLSGAFECNDRLIETADVLLFQDEALIDFEALSEFATLILITS